VDNLSIRAEQAMLGAVLSDPAGQQHVLDLVELADMSRPWHGQVLAAMQHLREKRAAPGPLEVYQELANDPDLPQVISGNAVLLADLMESAPRTGHAEAYAAMVIEGGIRQRLRLAGSRIAQAAGDGDLDATLQLAGQARRELGECRVRWLALPEPMRREFLALGREQQPHAGLARKSRTTRQEIERLSEDKPARAAAAPGEQAAVPAGHQAETPAVAASHPVWRVHQGTGGAANLSGAAALAVEVRALRDLAAAPSHLAEVRGWLQPEHFTRAGHGALYAVMQDMAAAGKPVDPVTAAWEAARLGIWTDPARLAGGTGLFAVASARKVHRQGLLAQAAEAGRGIEADSADAACSPVQLMQAAGDRLRLLRSGPAQEPAPDRQAQVLAMPGQASVPARNDGQGREAAQ